MEKISFEEVNDKYDLEINKIVKTIKKEGAKKILLQFPEGLKPYALVIAERIEEMTDCNCFIWSNTCFGACDLPIDVEKLGVDLIIQFGHSDWKYSRKDIQVLN